MKFIIVDNKTGRHRSFNANAFIFGVALAGLISIPAAAGYFAYRFGVGDGGVLLHLHPAGGLAVTLAELLNGQGDCGDILAGGFG